MLVAVLAGVLGSACGVLGAGVFVLEFVLEFELVLALVSVFDAPLFPEPPHPSKLKQSAAEMMTRIIAAVHRNLLFLVAGSCCCVFCAWFFIVLQSS